MKKERERRTLETAGMLFTLLFGNLLHFVYDWTGQAGWAAYLSAVNESTWELSLIHISEPTRPY